MLKQILGGVALLGIGFYVGTYHVAVDVEGAHAVATAAKVLRENKVLTLLESQDFAAARKAQTEFLRSSLLELRAMGKSWPSEVQAIVEMRKDLLLGK